MSPDTFEAFVMEAWLRFAAGLDVEIRDDLHRLAAYKTAFWAGAGTYRAALAVIETASSTTSRDREAMRARLDAGLRDFGASLQPLRRLDS